ncbi:acetyl-CoA carboxylase biotin carboxyl carrier protein [Jeotgalibacillus campisalis]|uniref:Biotin carboxyl carrier protein of acetyl-CoA carboxylase n=1 Tax=Jeotgalibacillus campisalis TaxID=220754 RepID=A0A0C2VPL4_9BACL|nr:acetyl-CoA carboxylase biotin carboxyl carrier protein [Jeotgalibacillus campisalis]KIL45948.1 acetyl-CoA carboxylase [Jeotgalibacillus campisalis]
MLKVQEIRELIKLIDQSTIDEFTYENDGEKIKLKKQVQTAKQPAIAKVVQEQAEPAPESAQPAPADSTKPAPEVQQETQANRDGTVEIKSPMVGTFYHASSPDAEAFVKVGSMVNEDSTVCIVEAMKLFNEIEAEVKGEIVEILVKDGQLVEYGQPLFLVKE